MKPFFKRLFIVLEKKIAKIEKVFVGNNKVVAKLFEKNALRVVEFLVLVCLVGGSGYLVFKSGYHPNLHKISLSADSDGTGVLATHHFSTVLNFQSLNEVKTPTASEAAFEVSHLDAAFGSDHATADFGATSTDGKKMQLLDYILFDTPGTDVDHDTTELQSMHSYCVTGQHMTETQYEDAFLHYSNNTTFSNGKVTPGWTTGSPKAGATATSRDQARVVHWSVGASQPNYYYLYNLNSPCFRGYMASVITGLLTVPQIAGHTYDGVFIDDMLGGALNTFTSANYSGSAHGGAITEYGDRTIEDSYPSDQGLINQFGNISMNMDKKYAYDQMVALKAVKDAVKATTGKTNFLMLPNTAQNLFPGSIATPVVDGAGGSLTEMWDSEAMGQKWGEKMKWDSANYITDKGGQFVWVAATLNGGGWNGFNSSNYTDAVAHMLSGSNPATASIVDETTGVQARHDMMTLSSYLMAKDSSNNTMYEQKATAEYGTNIPLSSYWDKAREMNIGQPKAVSGNPTGKYYLWKTSVGHNYDYTNYSMPTNTTADTSGQQVMVYRRDYDHAMVLFRTFDDNYLTWNYGAQSPTYDLGGNYHVLYPDGTLGPTITQIKLAVQEGVVLVPDGYDPMTGSGTVTPPQTSSNGKISLADGGSHAAGTTFDVAVDLTSGGNKICAATVGLTFPANNVAIDGIDLGPVFTQSVQTDIDNSAGTMTYVIGAPNCSTADSKLMTIHFRALNAGTGPVNLSGIRVVGGEDSNNMTNITTDTQNTTVTVTGTLPTTAPTTSWEITNGATASASGYYNIFPVIRLTATAAPNTTLSNIKYHWDADTTTTVTSGVVDGITIATDGIHTLTYYATNSAGDVEAPKTQTFKIDTAPKAKPVVDPYNQHTYKSSLTLKGTKTSDVLKIFVNDSESGVAFSGADGNTWQKDVNLTVNPGTDGSGKPTSLPQTFIITGEDAANNKNSADPVNITRHKMADMNNDLAVDNTDLGGFSFNWANFINPMADFNSDGLVDVSDFGLLMANWTQVH